MRAHRAGRSGFTLIEVLAVLLLTGIVLTVAIDFYLDLSRASQAAVDRLRVSRRAALLLDRVARDLESAVLVRKPDAVDPLAHPWVFLAEAEDPDVGADRIKFVSRGRRPRSLDAVESDLEMVAWMVAPGEEDDLELRRWSAPHLPEGLDRSFPPVEDSDPVATGVAAFGVRLQTEDGSWVARWDSSTLAQSGELPLSAEISVTLYADATSDEQIGPFVRRVLLPLRPLDLEAPGEEETGGIGVDTDGDGIPDEEEEEGGVDTDGDGVADAPEPPGDATGGLTVAQCLARHPQILATVRQRFGDQAAQILQAAGGLPAANAAAQAAQFGITIPVDCL